MRAGPEGGQWARSAVCPEQRLHIERFSKLAEAQFGPISSMANAGKRWVGFRGTATVSPLELRPFHLKVQVEALDNLKAMNPADTEAFVSKFKIG